NEDADEIGPGMLLKLLRPLPINVEQHVLPRMQCSLDRRAGRAVVVAKHLGPLEQFLAVTPEVELRLVDKMIVDAGNFTGTPGPGGHRHGHLQTRLATAQHARKRRLACAGGRGQHQHQPPASDLGKSALLLHARHPYSMFWTCSRSCSMATLRSTPSRVSSTS